MIVGIIGFIVLAVGVWAQIPPEDPKTVEARKLYGKFDVS